jgi:hypothetical protein
MPVKSGLGNFVLHTFGAEKTHVDNYLCTNSLPSSRDFRGQGGDLIQASFSRLQDIGGNTFTGQIVYNPEFIEEDGLNFNFR